MYEYISMICVDKLQVIDFRPTRCTPLAPSVEDDDLAFKNRQADLLTLLHQRRAGEVRQRGTFLLCVDNLGFPGPWGRRRCSGCPGRPQHRGRSSCCPVGGLQRLCPPRHSTLLWGLRVAKRAEHPGFHVIGVMAVKCPLTGVVSDQVGDHGFTVAEKDGVLA